MNGRATEESYISLAFNLYTQMAVYDDGNINSIAYRACQYIFSVLPWADTVSVYLCTK